MIATADLSVRAANGQQVAVIEVKNRVGLTDEIATALRQGVFGADGDVPETYFLLVSQEVAYLWSPSEVADFASPPTYSWPMHDVVARFWDAAGDRRLSGDGLQLIVVHWLNELAAGDLTLSESVRAPLEASGLLDALRGGSVLPTPQW